MHDIAQNLKFHRELKQNHAHLLLQVLRLAVRVFSKIDMLISCRN